MTTFKSLNEMSEDELRDYYEDQQAERQIEEELMRRAEEKWDEQEYLDQQAERQMEEEWLKDLND